MSHGIVAQGVFRNLLISAVQMESVRLSWRLFHLEFRYRPVGIFQTLPALEPRFDFTVVGA
jgi:hypothetical protein